MIEEGQIVLFPFPQTDQTTGKLRPALVLRKCPGPHGDWLICMISSQLRHAIAGTDEIIRPEDADFARTGLKEPSVIRVTRLAIVAFDMIQGAIGILSDPRRPYSPEHCSLGFRRQTRAGPVRYGKGGACQ